MENTRIKRGGAGYMLKIAYRNIYRNKRRSVLCISAIAMAVFFIAFMLGWISGMLGSVVDTVMTYETGHIQVYTKDYELKEEFIPVQYPLEFKGTALNNVIEEIKMIDGVKGVFPRIASYTTLTSSTVKHAVLWGIDTVNEFEVNNFNLPGRNNGLIEGRYPGPGENACAVGRRLANKMGVGIGDSIPLKAVSSQYSDRFWSPEIVGIFDFDYSTVDNLYIIVPFDRLQGILALRNRTQKIVIYMENLNNLDNVKAEVEAIMAENNAVDFIVKTYDQHPFIDTYKQFIIIYVIIFAVFIIVASFLIVNTVLMMIHERIKEIGMMGALGMTRVEISAVFFLEAVLLSVFGALVGIIIGGIVTFVMSLYPIDIVSMTGGIDMPLSNTIFIKFSWLYLAASFFFGVIISSVCTIFPSLKSAFIEPVEALRR